MLELVLYPLGHPISSVLTVIGIAGLPDDVATWQRWLTRVIRDDRVVALARGAAEFGEWVSQPSVRALLIGVGLLSMFWGVPRFWRFRHKLLFDWRSRLSEEVWIDHASAKGVLKNSTWGQLRKPAQSLFATISMNFTDSMTEAEKAQKRFNVFLDLTLKSFAANNPKAVRQQDGVEQYEEGALRRFAEAAMLEEVVKEFGSIPDASV